MATKKDDTWTLNSGPFQWIVAAFLLKMLAQILKKSGALERMKEAAEKTKTPLDNAIVRAFITFIEALD